LRKTPLGPLGLTQGPTPKYTVPRGMSSVCHSTIHTSIDTIHVEFSIKIHKIMRFVLLFCNRKQKVDGTAFCLVALLGQCEASMEK
jgi:hypothetical protein